jgi:hypothetical protein
MLARRCKGGMMDGHLDKIGYLAFVLAPFGETDIACL